MDGAEGESEQIYFSLPCMSNCSSNHINLCQSPLLSSFKERQKWGLRSTLKSGLHCSTWSFAAVLKSLNVQCMQARQLEEKEEELKKREELRKKQVAKLEAKVS